jgi:hypothetical protein
LFLAAAVLALASGGCATGHAKTAAVPTPLDVPAPPPRIIAPVEPEASTPPPPPIVAKPTPQKPAAQASAPPPVVKSETPRPPDPPAVTAPPAATLQQALPAAQGDLERQVRENLKRAQSDLKRVNLGALNADAKSQYDTARRFVAEAEQAFKEGNVVFAAKVAEKAAALAAGLPFR